MEWRLRVRGRVVTAAGGLLVAQHAAEADAGAAQRCDCTRANWSWRAVTAGCSDLRLLLGGVLGRLRLPLLVIGLVAASISVMPGIAGASVDRHIVFEGDRDGLFGLWEANSDGSDPWLVVDDVASQWYSIGPDGRSIANSRQDGFGGSLQVVDLDNGTGFNDTDSARVVYSALGNHSFGTPRWSPDGSRLVFADTDYHVGTTTIRTVGANGEDPTAVAQTWANAQRDAQPDFSPAGTEITYAGESSTSPGHMGIYVVNADGTDPLEITNPGDVGWVSQPRFSPDGSRVAFAGIGSDGDWDLWTIAVDGSDLRQMTHGIDAWAPTWSADGTKLVFDNESSPDYGLYTVPSDGSGDVESFASTAQGFDFASYASFPPSGSNAYVSDERYLEAQFEPIMRFHTSEQWRPLDVDAFMHEADPSDPGHTFNKLCVDFDPCTDLPSDWLGALRAAGTGDVRIQMGTPSGASHPISPDSACYEGDVKECDSGPRAAMYAHVTPALDEPATSGYHYVDYWAFYRYNLDQNDLTSPDDHQGDWEGLTVAPSLDKPRAFDFVIMAQHKDFSVYAAEDVECGAEDLPCGNPTDGPLLSRVWDYVANGTHASYPHYDGGVAGICLQEKEQPLPEGCHDGAAPWKANHDASRVIEFPPTGDWQSDPGTGTWVDWPGHWGADRPAGFFGLGASPPSPGTQQRFQCPWNIAYPYIACLSKTRASRADSARTKTAIASSCGNWAGAMVAAAVCSPSRLRDAVATGKMGRHGRFQLTLPGHTARVANLPGVAQALATPLTAGERLEVHGPVPRDGVLLVRAQVHRRLTEATFGQLDMQRGGRGALIVTARHGRPSLLWVAPGGRKTHATSTRTVTLPRGSTAANRRRSRGRSGRASDTGAAPHSPAPPSAPTRACRRRTLMQYVRAMVRHRKDTRRRQQPLEPDLRPHFRC